MKPIQKNSPWKPFGRISIDFFTDPPLSTSTLAVGCMVLSRFSHKKQIMLSTSCMTIALTMGFSRSHTFNLIKQLTASKFIRKVEGVKANKFYDLGDSTRYVMVPKVLIKHEGLTADEKLVWIALHNRSVLKITTKKELAAAVKMHPRTLTKVIAELIKVNVLRKASFSKWPLMNEPNSWRVIRDYHPVKHGAEWEKLGYEVRSTAPTVKKDCPTLELVDDDYLNVGQGV